MNNNETESKAKSAAIKQIQAQKRAEANVQSAPAMVGGMQTVAAQKRMAFNEPPTAVKTDPLS